MGLSIQAQKLSQSAGALDSTAPIFEVSLEWEGPGLFVIMGESGGGKSTLLKTLGGVWKPRSGQLLIDGQRLWTGPAYEQNLALLSRIGFCFQNNALFNSMSCLENLAFPHRQRFPKIDEATRQKLSQEWLEKVGIGHSAQLLPHELSGGMQKRLSLARSLILKPDFLFFDDPTAGLDPITSKQIALMLKELLKDNPALSIIVTNDEDRAKDWSQQIFELKNESLQPLELR